MSRKPMIRIIAACLSLFMVLPYALCMTLAQEDEQPIRIGYYENEVFQEGARPGVAKTGYAYEYYRKLSEYTGWKYEYVYGSYGELYQMLLEGKIDMLAGLAKTEDRTGKIGYPDVAMGYEFYSLIKHTSLSEVNAEPSTLNGRKIGILDSAMKNVLQTFLDERNVDAEVIVYQDYEELFSAFDNNQIDILAAESDGTYSRENTELVCLLGNSDYYLCVSIQRPDLLAELNNAQTLLSLDEPSFINSLRVKYYSTSIFSRSFSPVEKDWISSHDSLSVGYLMNYLPYSDMDNDGNPTGIVIDILPMILDNLEIELDITWQGYQNYDKMIEALNEKVIDVAFPVGGGLYYSEENGIYQSSPLASVSNELVFKGDYSDDKLEHFAVNENNRMQYYYIRTYFPKSKITLYPSINDCLEAVKAGKASATTLNGFRASDILRNSQYSMLSRHPLGYNNDRCFGVVIGNEGLLKLMNRGLTLIDTDYAQNISYRYASQLYKYTFMDFAKDNMGIVAFVGFLMIGIVFFFLYYDMEQAKMIAAEREQSRIALQRALDSAEHANKSKTAFLNNMSHDIRTPMNAIVGFTDLAKKHVDETELVKDYLSKISISSSHLLSLINDVLDLSRIESGKMTLEPSDASISDIIQEMRTITQANASEKDLHLSFNAVGITHEHISVDRLRLKQVLLNILSNAIKFTPPGGSIDFTVRELPSSSPTISCLRFVVKDTGIGISPEFQKTIFEAFTREKSATVNSIQGTGLGMAICKSIVDSMGGKIWVESTLGEGSEFFVEISCPVVSPKETTEEVVVEPEAVEEVDFSGKHILLAEDNIMNQMIATAILEEMGFTITIANDGNEAVGLMKDNPVGTYDIILMDVQMPNMDGYEATRIIRSMEPSKAAIPIVAVTANAFEEDKKMALEKGMNAHLAKPYDIAMIKQVLSDMLITKTPQEE